MTTLTREEANRARESAVRRRQAAQDDLDCWSFVIAEDAVRNAGMPDRITSAQVSGDRFIIARAAAFEAHADWQEARERWQAVAIPAPWTAFPHGYLSRRSS